MSENLKILLSDDESSIRRFLSEFLTHHEYNVTEAKNGQQALELYQNQDFDLVITDIDMPLMNGLELVQEIKKIKADQKIICMSGTHTSSDTYFISKPFNITDLSKLITSIIPASQDTLE